jgi:ribosomal protein S18 acetylase RimI-like enzyme
MTAVIRPYVDSDFDFVRKLFSGDSAEEKRRLAAAGFRVAWENDEEYLHTLIDRVRDVGLFLIAEVGAVMRRENASWDATTRPSAIVWELHVDRGFQRQGDGRQLLQEAEGYFRSRGIDWLSLGVFATNEEAQSFYGALGYDDVYTFKGKRLDSSG